MLRLLSIAALLVSSWACTVQLVNGRYTNTCGCSFSYSNGTTCSAVVTTLTTISSNPLTVQNWPDADLADAPQCYTRSYYNSLGASTSLFPVGTDSVLVDCDGVGNRTLRVLRILPFLVLAVALAAGLGAAGEGLLYASFFLLISVTKFDLQKCLIFSESINAVQKCFKINILNPNIVKFGDH